MMTLQQMSNRKSNSMTRAPHPQGARRLITGLSLLVIVAASFIVPTPAPIYAAQTITIAPTQPVYLVNNGDTANVGFRMTFTGTPAEGLDRDITLELTAGTALQVGGSPGNAQNVATTLAGANTTIAAVNTALAQGRGRLEAVAAGATQVTLRSGSTTTDIFIGQTLNIDTGARLEAVTVTEVGTTNITFTPPLASAHLRNSVYAGVTPAGSMNIRVADLTNFAAGQMIQIDSGTNSESASVAEVGGGGATILSAAAAAGTTNIKVDSVADLVAGNKLWIGMGADQESAIIASVGTEGESGTGVTLASPLANDHVAGAPVTGNILVLTSALTLSHAVTSYNAPGIPVVSVTAPGVTNIKVVDVTGFVAGQEISIDTGANLEIATIATVGTPGFAGTGLDLTSGLLYAHAGAAAVVQTEPAAFPGATNVKVDSVMGYYPGDSIRIDSGANAETRTIVAVGTPGLFGTGIDLADPLDNSHLAGAAVADTRVLQSTAVSGVDYTVPSNTVVIPAGSASGTEVTIPIDTLPNPNPSVALTINMTAACTVGCTGVTVNNNDPPTVVINAHGFPYLDSSLPIAARVADLMSRMTLFDKVAQMTQTNMTVLGNGTTTNESSPNGIRVWRLGSILSGGTDSPTPNSPTGWADLIDGFEYRAMATPLQVPLIYGIDTIHGNSHMIGSVLFPHDVGMGATRDPDLSYLQGVIAAQETRSTGPQWGFGPTICAARDIRWGRTYECYGEDPDLVNLMETIIEGYQGPDPMDMSGMHIVTSSKHFAGDGATQNGRNAGVDVMSYEEFARVALAQYVPAVQKYHTGTIMPSYSSTQLDGATTSILMSANADLMTGWLKNTIGFEGYLISDYNAINSIPVPSPNPLPSPINQSYAYQAMISFNAGMDMVMSPNNPAWKNFINYVQTLVSMGYMSQSRIDDAVRRILTQKFALGLFEQPFTDRSTQDQILSAEHRAVAREATAKSQVLLKNADNILPLSKTAKIYLAGSNADSVINQAGGWSISWQSIPTGDVPAVDTYFTTIREAIQNVVGTDNVTYSATASPAPGTGTYDVGIVVVGETAYAEGSGDVPSAKSNTPTTADATAINNVCSVMPCIIMTVAGRPFWLTDAQFSAAQAVVASWIGSSEGDGIGDVLFGDVDFTGRLPMTWSRDASQEPINVGDATYDPRYPFGWGLRTGSTKARLQHTRDSLAAISGDAHVSAAVAYLDQLLAADVWNADGSASDPGATLRSLQSAANELAATTAETFTQDDGVVSAARDIAQANIVRNGGPDATNSPLIADADHALLIGQPDLAVMLLTQASGDVTPPVTSVVFDPAPVNGWITTDPTVTLLATDDGVGVARTDYRLDGGAWTTYSGPFQVTGDMTHLLDFYSTDQVGNVESMQSVTFNVDTTPPTIDLVAPVEAVTQVVDQPGNYPLNSVQNASYSCADNFSGVASCVGTVPNGSPFDTSTVGFHTFTVEAEDVAGHTTTVTHQYNVVWNEYGGFTPPLSEGAMNEARAGSTVPIKFSLGADFGLDIFAEGYPYSVEVDCMTQAEIGPHELITDWKIAGGYHADWKTDGAWGGTCRLLSIKLLDNTVHTATFSFK
jgi:beta-glucosidase-like glycosyl hydrolase